LAVVKRYPLGDDQPPVSPNHGGILKKLGDTPSSPGRRNPAPLSPNVSQSKRITINSDGAAVPNPGPAGIGAILRNDKGDIVAEISKYIGSATNNKAEFLALIAGLKRALELGAEHVDINSDSELIVRQIEGKYRSKVMKPLFDQVVSLLGEFKSYTVQHIPREQNTEADALSKRALKLKSKDR
jgi:ribonuclease HI